MTENTPGDGTPLTFPAGFTWGAATAAYQIEGAVAADGRGLSVWDTFSHTPGKVRGGDTGDIACDSYHRYGEDADLLKSLGLSAYRFSVSWPRIFPDGAGKLNQAGLDYYRRLCDALAERGIAGTATLFHWDLPQALQDAGGWASRDTARRFADYAGAVAEALGGRVARWITLNEPQVVTHLGHRLGIHAPGLTDPDAAAAATHHLMLGHGLAVGALRAALPAGAEVGITLNFQPVRVAPESAGSPEVEAARLATDAANNLIFLDPVVHGRYPEHAPREMLPPTSLIADGDMAAIAAPLDFLGVNYYFPAHLRAGDPDSLRRGEEAPHPGIRGAVEYRPEGMGQTAMGWPWLIDPDAFHELLLRLSKEAPGLPLYVTENGCAAEDYAGPDGIINDEERIAYLHGHLSAAARAIRDGASLAGYYVWSLLDNFEWAYGYQKRFGIVFVDFATQARIPKASANWYAEAARTNTVPPLPGGESLADRGRNRPGAPQRQNPIGQRRWRHRGRFRGAPVNSMAPSLSLSGAPRVRDGAIAVAGSRMWRRSWCRYGVRDDAFTYTIAPQRWRITWFRSRSKPSFSPQATVFLLLSVCPRQRGDPGPAPRQRWRHHMALSPFSPFFSCCYQRTCRRCGGEASPCARSVTALPSSPSRDRARNGTFGVAITHAMPHLRTRSDRSDGGSAVVERARDRPATARMLITARKREAARALALIERFTDDRAERLKTDLRARLA